MPSLLLFWHLVSVVFLFHQMIAVIFVNVVVVASSNWFGFGDIQTQVKFVFHFTLSFRCPTLEKRPLSFKKYSEFFFFPEFQGGFVDPISRIHLAIYTADCELRQVSFIVFHPNSTHRNTFFNHWSLSVWGVSFLIRPLFFPLFVRINCVRFSYMHENSHTWTCGLRQFNWHDFRGFSL